MAKGKTQKPANGSNLDFEAQPWAVADEMRGYMDAAWKLARMNPAIPGFDADLGPHNASRRTKSYKCFGGSSTTTNSSGFGLLLTARKFKSYA
jgi:hypothetical protein